MSRGKRFIQKRSVKLDLMIPYDHQGTPVVSNSLYKKIARKMQNAKRKGLNKVVDRGRAILKKAGMPIPAI